MLEKLEIIQELSSLFSGADVYLMPNTEPEIREYLSKNASKHLHADIGNHPAIGQICKLDSDHIYEFLPFPGVAALVYSCKNLNKILFVGPVATDNYNSQSLLAYLQRQNLPQATVSQMMESVSRLPIMTAPNLYRFMDILLRRLCDTDAHIPVKQMESASDFIPATLYSEVNTPKDIHQIRQIEDRYETSSLLTEAVKLGNLSLALQTLGGNKTMSDIARRSRSPLRNMQNYCIVLNTQLRHSLEGSGVHPYELDRLSNDIGLQIERLNAPDMVIPFTTYIIEQYCHLVQEHSYNKLSTLTHQAVIYIKNNLNANLTVKETAKELSVHPDYLSHQFSQEMGMTFISFLNQERCRQAASYLKHTNLQIKQISAIVGFNTISYFTKQFANVYRKTPRDFRNERIFRKPNRAKESMA